MHTHFFINGDKTRSLWSFFSFLLITAPVLQESISDRQCSSYITLACYKFQNFRRTDFDGYILNNFVTWYMKTFFPIQIADHLIYWKRINKKGIKKKPKYTIFSIHMPVEKKTKCMCITEKGPIILPVN